MIFLRDAHSTDTPSRGAVTTRRGESLRQLAHRGYRARPAAATAATAAAASIQPAIGVSYSNYLVHGLYDSWLQSGLVQQPEMSRSFQQLGLTALYTVETLYK